MEESTTMNVYQDGNFTETEEQFEIAEIDEHGNICVRFWKRGKNTFTCFVDPDTARHLARILLERAQ
jgi:hypothetical protein